MLQIEREDSNIGAGSINQNIDEDLEDSMGDECGLGGSGDQV